MTRSHSAVFVLQPHADDITEIMLSNFGSVPGDCRGSDLESFDGAEYACGRLSRVSHSRRQCLALPRHLDSAGRCLRLPGISLTVATSPARPFARGCEMRAASVAIGMLAQNTMDNRPASSCLSCRVFSRLANVSRPSLQSKIPERKNCRGRGTALFIRESLSKRRSLPFWFNSQVTSVEERLQLLMVSAS